MDDVSRAVQAWYRAAYWGPQNKDLGWADYILVDDGAMLAGQRVLNLGCYWPEDELYLGPRAAHWTAIDFTPEVVDAARGLIAWPPTIEFREGDMRALAFPDESFDVVLDFSTGDHLAWRDYRKAVREAHRVLVPRGRFVVVFANRAAMSIYVTSWAHGQRDRWECGYTRADSLEEMRALLAEEGFVIEREANTHLPRSGFLARRTD